MMVVNAMTTSHLPFNLRPRHRDGPGERRSARLISKRTRALKKFDRMKCYARLARDGCSSETRRAIRSITGRNIKNDAQVRCESLHVDIFRSQLVMRIQP